MFIINVYYKSAAFGFFVKTKAVLKQPPRAVPRKRYSENIKQIYRRTPMPKCDFTLLKSHFGMGVLL